MTMDLSLLDSHHQLLFAIPLRPVQGHRFQPTGFPDLGAAVYETPEGTCLLVESAQSMANRLEATCWDDAKQALIDELVGLSYVRVEQGGKYLTSSVTEAHRINSPYMLEGKDKTFFNTLKQELAIMERGPIDRPALARTLFKYDVGSLLHGVFLAKKDLAGGRLRVARALSAFIEARNARVAASGGVKNDHVDPSGDTNRGFGNVPFHREEFTADEITLFANVDLSQIRGYGLDGDATRLLVLLALFKLRALLDGKLRLRTACDLAVKESKVVSTNLAGFELPSRPNLESAVKESIRKSRAQVAGDSGVTTVKYEA